MRILESALITTVFLTGILVANHTFPGSSEQGAAAPRIERAHLEKQ